MSKELSPMFFQVDPVPYSHGGTCVYICRRDVDDYATCRSAFNVDSVSKGFEEANLLNKALEEQYEMPPKYYENTWYSQEVDLLFQKKAEREAI